jgi:hypothetical protein
MVSGDTGSILFKRLQLQKMNPAKQLEWINSLPTLCNAKLDELKGIHNKLFDLNLEANEYLNENGERQLEWEQQFVQEFAVAIAKYRETTAAKFELDESFKAAFGVLPSYWDDSSLAVWKVTRLVKTQNEIKDNGIKEGLVKTSGETNVVKDAASAESVQTTTLETTETSTTVAKTVEKKTVGDEDKKTVEKGKDESGVEDS